MQNRKPKLLDSITNLVRNIVSLAETRLSLFALDIHESALILLSLIVMSGIILTCFGFALLLITLLVIVFFWDSHRLLALGGATAFYTVVGLSFWYVVFVKLRSMPKFFAATRGEFAKDREWLARDEGRVTEER
jgi:uncharacterized membrane protein YqjE